MADDPDDIFDLYTDGPDTDDTDAPDAPDDTDDSDDSDDSDDTDDTDDSNDSDDSEALDHIKARAPLKHEIMALIKPHHDSAHKPPFTAAEMIVMSIICGDGKSYNMFQILRNICSTYQYYSKRASRVLFRNARDMCIYRERTFNFSDDVYDIVNGFRDAFSNYAVPLVDFGDLDYNRPERNRYTVTPMAARIFLEEQLVPARKGTFPIFKLPAELRVYTYALALRFPRPGFLVASTGSWLTTRFNDKDLPVTKDVIWKTTKSKTKGAMALLHVCRQIYQEAMPIFYSENMFCFCGLDSLLYTQIRPNTFPVERLKNVYIDLCNYEKLDNASLLLSSIKRLDLLVVDAGVESWTRIPAEDRKALFNRTTKFTKAEQIPGFFSLAQVAAKAVKFELCGDCPKTREFFDAEVEKIKAGKGPSKVPKKRGRKPKGQKAGVSEAKDGGSS